MGLEHRLLFLVVLVVVAEPSTASHFRGAIISWKPGSGTNEIDVNYRISWRMTYSNSFICDKNTIKAQTRIGGEGNLECFHNCSSSTMGALYYTCTDYSTSEDWSSGLGTIQHRFRTQTLIHEFGFKGSAWISTLNYGSGGLWKLWVHADLSVRSDTGKINSSPTAQIPPIVRLQHGCNHTITIPVNDPDGDVVKCVWAYKRNNSCGDICHGFPNSSLNSEKCNINYEATYQTGWFAVAIQVEDYVDANSGSYLSSIPVQFLVQVYQSRTSCSYTLEFIGPTPSDNARICVPNGEKFNSAIVARVLSANESISEIKTISPVGLTHTMLQNVSETVWRVNFTYSPQNNSDTTNIFCFIAIDSLGMESEKRCITLINGAPAPTLVNGSQFPSGRVPSYQRHWSISFDSEFDLSTNHSFIRMYDATNRLVERIDASDRSKVTASKNTLQFVTTSTLQVNEYYYFLFDAGVVNGKSTCGADSVAINDPFFWRFLVDSQQTSLPWWYNVSTAWLTAMSTTPSGQSPQYHVSTAWQTAMLTTPSGQKLEDAIYVNCNEYGWEINVNMDILRRINPSAKASDIYLGENTCTGVESWNTLTFRQGVRECLTSESIRNDAVVYSNELVYAEHDPQHPFIIRYYAWTIGVECDVQRNETSTGHLHHQSINSGANFVSSNSHYAVNMTLFRDSNYQYPIQGNPLQVPVGTEVFVKVFTAASDWTIKMRVHTCYTKPTSLAPDNMKYFLITNGCESDVNTHMISQSAHETRFVFRNFEYTGNHEGIFVFCDATFCGSYDYSTQCMQTCNPSG